MNKLDENLPGKPVIVIEEKPDVVPDQPAGEIPEFIFENDEKPAADDSGRPGSLPPKPRRRWLWIAGSAAAAAAVCLLMLAGYRYYRTYINIGVPVSATSKENIAKLQQPPAQERPEVVMSSDSILGVGFNIYELRGLRATISFDQPDTADREVYLYSRSSDFTSYDPATCKYLGSLVAEGKELSRNVSRLGYCAMAGGNVVIGVARDERVKDYCMAQGGSFFRQFILVSDGVMPTRYYLHGKVERRALGRMGDRLYYVESHGKESLWSFADALREYGFVDAIYITGGNDYCFYRDAEGRCHDIGDTATRSDEFKGTGLIPWLVFVKR